MEPKAKIRKNFNLSPADVRALGALIAKGYSFSNTEVGVIQRALREIWEKEFPGKPYPTVEKVERDP